jgi:biopolymer transport protein ExbD
VAIWLLTVVAANAQAVKIDLPLGKNAVADAALGKESTVIVSLLARDQYYFGGLLIPKEQLGKRIDALLRDQNEGHEIVYVAADTNVDYGSLVELFEIIRKQRVGQVGLVVNRETTEGAKGVFLVEFPLLVGSAADIAKLKPNPLNLVAAISADLGLRLNDDDSSARSGSCFSTAPDGFGTDPARIERFLNCFFRQRTELRVYKVGMETQTDVPEAERIEKTVFVKASRSVKYGDVVRLINAVKGAGANPIGLQIDDLPQ